MKSSVVVYGLVGVLSLAMAVHGLDCAAGTYFFKRADGEPVCPECPSGFYCVGCTKCNDDWNSGSSSRKKETTTAIGAAGAETRNAAPKKEVYDVYG